MLTATQARKRIMDAYANDTMPFTMKAQTVSFSDLARAQRIFVKLIWPAQSEVPVIAPEFKQATYKTIQALFTKDDGVIID